MISWNLRRKAQASSAQRDFNADEAIAIQDKVGPKQTMNKLILHEVLSVCAGHGAERATLQNKGWEPFFT